MIDRQYIPLIVFVTCLVLALALALFTGAWPTSLAIALSGCALAYAMRPPPVEDHDTAFLQEDMADIRAVGDQQGEDIAALRTSVDEVAQIVESLATDMQRLSASSDSKETEKLRALIDAMGSRVAALDVPQRQVAARIDTLEQSLVALRSKRAQEEEIIDLRTIEPVALAATGTNSQGMIAGGRPVAVDNDRSASAAKNNTMTERAGRLRDRFSRTSKTPKVGVVPLFDRDRAAASLLVEDAGDQPSVEGSVAVIRHALSLIEESEKSDTRIFARLAPEIVGDAALIGALEPIVAKAGDALKHLVVIVTQADIQGGPPKALGLMMKAGARFGLERILDWSADLDALASRGLAVIAVDGPAMAKSASAQKGDPTRLKQVLEASGIELMAGEIETQSQLDAVKTLVPDLLAGPGLGKSTVVDVPE